MIIKGDCIAEMQKMPTDSVDLVFGSPPYEDARTYGIDFKVKGQDWVDWMVVVYIESLRVCKGLVAYVVEGKTRKFSYSGTPLLLAADLIRAGVTLRKPPIYRRDGIPGSGGPDWLRNDYEFIICATNGGRLPWSDNTAMGKICKHAPGGAMSYRHADGRRRNARTGRRLGPKVEEFMANPILGAKLHTKREIDGTMRTQCYTPPKKANPGNIIHCNVGGGQMGSKIAHENEAPFPLALAEFFVKSFCPPGGITLDPFCGSGTTGAAAVKAGREFIGIDVRASQVALSYRRLSEARRQINVPIEEL